MTSSSRRWISVTARSAFRQAPDLASTSILKDRKVPRDGLTMRNDIIARQRKIMADNGLDALVAVSPENFAWTTGFVVPSHRSCAGATRLSWSRRTARMQSCRSTWRRRRFAIACRAKEVRVWGEFDGDAMKTLAALLTDMGLAQRASASR